MVIYILVGVAVVTDHEKWACPNIKNIYPIELNFEISVYSLKTTLYTNFIKVGEGQG